MSCCPPPPRGEARAVHLDLGGLRQAQQRSADRGRRPHLGATQKARWNYATSKSFGEALALGYHKELGADNVVVRLFNTVGPRQSGHTAWSCRASPARRERAGR